MPVCIWDTSGTGYRNLKTGVIFSNFIVNVTEPVTSNTGPRSAPQGTASGVITLTGNGGTFVYSGMSVAGRIVVPNNATGTIIIEDNIIDGSSLSMTGTLYVITVGPNTSANVIIRFNEIMGKAGMMGIGTRRFEAYRNNIHHVEDGLRISNVNGTGTELNTKVYANKIGPLILETPDPFFNRSDNKTHSDCIQIEGGDGLEIYGNALHGYKTTDGTSNVQWVRSVAPHDPVPAGDPAGREHPQVLSTIMLTPNVGPITNINIHHNWHYGGEIPMNLVGEQNVNTTGTVTDERFSRDQWFPGNVINIRNGSAITPQRCTYMDNGSPVPVNYVNNNAPVN